MGSTSLSPALVVVVWMILLHFPGFPGGLWELDPGSVEIAEVLGEQHNQMRCSSCDLGRGDAMVKP